MQPHHHKATTYWQEGMFYSLTLLWSNHWQGIWPATLSCACICFFHGGQALNAFCPGLCALCWHLCRLCSSSTSSSNSDSVYQSQYLFAYFDECKCRSTNMASCFACELLYKRLEPLQRWGFQLFWSPATLAEVGIERLSPTNFSSEDQCKKMLSCSVVPVLWALNNVWPG